MIINHNVSALNTYRQLSINNALMAKSLEKLSSGLRINRAGDDAAGLAISEKMRGQIRGLSVAVKNSQDAISLIQTAEGALNETHSILQRMRELAVQAANDTNTLDDRKEIQKEINQLIDEIDRIATTTQFNTKNILGKFTVDTPPTITAEKVEFTFQIGANSDQFIKLTINPMDSTSLGDTSATTSINNLKVDDATLQSITDETDASGKGVLTYDDANKAISVIDKAIAQVSAERSKLGAYQNRLEHTINNLSVASENLTAAESRIRDVDYAEAA